MLVDLVRSMGFDTTDIKNVTPTQRLTFLGGGLDTNTDGKGTCSKFVDDERRTYVAQQCEELEHAKGKVNVRRIMSVLGMLGFCAELVDGMRMYLRSGWDLIRGKEAHVYVTLTRAFRMDLAFLRKLLLTAAARTMLTRRQVTSTFGSWDACTGWGMGGFFDGMWFAMSWSALLAMPNTPRFYPTPDSPSMHINYLELFAGYWFLLTWGPRLVGMTLVYHTDNTATEGMLNKMTGTKTFIPLLKEILLLLVKFDIKLVPVRITSKDNTLSDYLSRGEMTEFLAALRRWSETPAMEKELEDWQLFPKIVHEDLEEEYGSFDRDACVDQYRTNTHCEHSWNEEDDCRRQNWGGLHVFCNGPFSILLSILMHFVECKLKHPVGTAAVFIVPLWPTADFWLYAMSKPKIFVVARRWPTGSELFTAQIPAHKGGGRKYNGPTRWPVVALRVNPTAIEH